jgi:hypothetical protein
MNGSGRARDRKRLVPGRAGGLRGSDAEEQEGDDRAVTQEAACASRHFRTARA